MCVCVFILSNFRLLFLFRYVCAQRETHFVQKYCLSSLLSFLFLVLILDSFSLMKLSKCCCCLVTCWKNGKKEYVSLARQILSYRALFCLLPFPFPPIFYVDLLCFTFFVLNAPYVLLCLLCRPHFELTVFIFFLETAQPLCARRWPDFTVLFFY